MVNEKTEKFLANSITMEGDRIAKDSDRASQVSLERWKVDSN